MNYAIFHYLEIKEENNTQETDVTLQDSCDDLKYSDGDNSWNSALIVYLDGAVVFTSFLPLTCYNLSNS